MAGDDSSGGDAEEAIVPLSDPEAMDRMVSALLLAPTLRAASAAMRPAPAEASRGSSPGQGSSPDQGSASSNEKGSGADPWGAGSSGGGDTHNHYYIKGMVSPDTLKKLAKTQNRMVKNRQLTVNASNSLRVTRRSQ